jgi:hypothetical protein
MNQNENKDSNILDLLNSRKFILGRVLENSLDMKLRDYLKSVIVKNKDVNKKYLQYVLESLAHYLFKKNHQKVEDACAHLENYPVIQQADHSNILLDEETFLNNYLFALGCAEAGVDKMIVSQCSTVSCLSRRDPVAGPIFLRTRGVLYKVFPFSKRFLKDSSFCCIPSPVTLNFEALEGKKHTIKEDELLSSLNGRQFDSITQCYYTCNNEIWEILGRPAGIERFAVDESMTSEIAAFHILDKASPIHSLIFNAEVRDCFVEIKRNFISSPHNRVINHSAPDFLWFKSGSRLRPVILKGKGLEAALYIENQGTLLPISYTPEAIAQALKDGNLYVDKIIAYLVRCLLPGITAIGGTSQQDYVQHYIEMIIACHEQIPFLDDKDLVRIKSVNLSRLGGAPLLELNDSQKEIIANLNKLTNLKEFSNSFLDLTIEKTIGKLSCAGYLLQNF